MVDGGGGTPFPVIFFDGEREIHIGNILVHPMLDYKTFQFMLSQRIGISPNQISIYLLDRKYSKSSHSADDRRKIPITGKANFALICRAKDNCILVVLKRSRKARSRKLRSNGFDYSSWQNDYHHQQQPENVILLRRNQPLEANFDNRSYNSSPFYDRISPAELALNERLQSMRIQSENYNAAAMMNPKANSDHNLFPKLEEIYNSMTMTKTEAVFFCNECVNSEKNGVTAPFHHCLNDDVVVGFRSWAGPIGSIFR